MEDVGCLHLPQRAGSIGISPFIQDRKVGCTSCRGRCYMVSCECHVQCEAHCDAMRNENRDLKQICLQGLNSRLSTALCNRLLWPCTGCHEIDTESEGKLRCWRCWRCWHLGIPCLWLCTRCLLKSLYLPTPHFHDTD